MEKYSIVKTRFHKYDHPCRALVTTSFGFYSVLSISSRLFNPFLVYASVMLYGYSLILTLPMYLWCVCILYINGFVHLVQVLDDSISLINLLYMLLVSILFQDFSHYLCERNVKTRIMYMNDIYYFLPCVIDSIEGIESILMGVYVPFDNVVYGRIANTDVCEKINRLFDWVKSDANTISKSHTTHMWYTHLPTNEQSQFHSIATSNDIIDTFRLRYNPCHYTIELVEDMNEIYVASEKHNSNSDSVFFMKHIDGPWYLLFPYCKLYRCILAINDNKRISTVFPNLNKTFTLTTGEFVGFDFNREIHYIQSNSSIEPPNEQRVTLKLHYVVYPNSMMMFGNLLKWMTTKYDIRARQLFLYTLKPKHTMERLMAKSILVTTYITFFIEKYIGYYNIVLLLGLYLLNSTWFFMVINYHYYFKNIFINQFHGNTSIGLTRRDLKLYKFLSNCNLCFQTIRYYKRSFATTTTSNNDVVVSAFYVLMKDMTTLFPIVSMGVNIFITVYLLVNRFRSKETIYKLIWLHNIMYILEYVQKIKDI